MSKHDTWVRLKPNSPYKSIEHLFPEGFPMRDPFPMEVGRNAEGEIVPLWIVDIDRLEEIQMTALSVTIARGCNTTPDIVISEALEKKGFSISHVWVDSMCGGAENYRRTIEFLDSEKQIEVGKNAIAWERFYQQQLNDWINGDRIPEPMPASYKDIDPRMKTPQLEKAYKQIEIEKFLSDGDYSLFDVLSGAAVVDALSQIDPENDWELATD